MNHKLYIALLFSALFLLFLYIKANAQPSLNVEWITNEDVFYAGDPTPQPNTEALKDAVIEVINSSTSTLDIALYGLNAQSVVDAIIDARNRGVRVRIVGHGDYVTHASYGWYYSQLQGVSGISFVLSDGDGLQHNKFIIADGRHVLTGSTNFTTTGFYYNLNNVMVFRDDMRIANAYTCKFNEMFVDRRFGLNASASCGGTFEYAGGVSVEVIFTPNQGEYYINSLVELINQSDAIYGNWFYLTLDDVGNAMVNALSDGTTLHAVMDANGFSGSGSEGRNLCTAGANIKVEAVGGKMHEKTMLLHLDDGTKVIWTGSANFSRSASIGSSTYGANDENTVVIRGADSLFDTYLNYFWRVFDELPPHQYCRTTNAENNIAACQDGHDNDHDSYYDENDFNCDEATLETCQDGKDNDGDGYVDVDDYGCWLINRLCPPKPPEWLTPQNEDFLLTLKWTELEVDGMTPLYQIYGSNDMQEWHLVLATTFTDWQVPKELPYRFLRLGGEGCLDIPQSSIIQIEYPFVIDFP